MITYLLTQGYETGRIWTRPMIRRRMTKRWSLLSEFIFDLIPCQRHTGPQF